MAENTLKRTDKHKHTITPTSTNTTNRGSTNPKKLNSQPFPLYTQQEPRERFGVMTGRKPTTMFSPFKNIFWMTLHTASALAATIILNLPIADTLTEETTSILKHLQTAAALYYQEQATEVIRTYSYQPTSLWEATVQDAIDTAIQLTQYPHLIMLTIALAVIAAVIRYCFMLHQLKKQQRHQQQSCTLTTGRMLTLHRLLAKLAAVLSTNSTSITSHARQKPPTRRLQHATSWFYWLYKALQLLTLMM